MDINQKMQIAIDMAKEGLKGNLLPVGAVIFHGDKIISKAYATDVLNKTYLAHAEMNVLWEADNNKYSVKERKQMQLFVTLEPCMMCLGAAMSFFIGEVYYALEAPIDGAVGFAKEFWKGSSEIPAYSLPKIYGGILRNQSQELFAEYTKQNNSGAMYEFAKTLSQL
jgi:tRNA(adenine34) deaminase